MNGAPIPALTAETLTGAIADLIRAAAVWGAESTQQEPDERTYIAVCQYTAQLFALVKRADPTDDELSALFQQLGGQPPT